jgi:eukaryotic-like serine/threonine-protein kinase
VLAIGYPFKGMPPKQIGPYRIEATLGRGGIGTVYRAHDRRSGGPVALKLLSTGPALEATAALRLAREFETLAEITHPNVVRVFDVGVFEGYPYLAMELIEGLDLRTWLSLDLNIPTGRGARESSGTSSLEQLSSAAAADDEPWTEDASLASITSPEVEAFDLDALRLEPDTDALALSLLSHGHSRGIAALHALAQQADEPVTDEREGEESGTPPPPVESAAAGPAATLPEGPRLDWLNRSERISRLKDAMQQLCQALACIHGRGLIHRDLKPGNVLVNDDRRVKLMDFGLAKFLANDGSVTGSGRIVGTYRYMAPEQALGEPMDGRADLYSLGVMLYELLSGRPPYDARTPMELWKKVLETEAPLLTTLNPGVDRPLSQVAHRLMRKSPEDRYQTAEEVFDALME